MGRTLRQLDCRHNQHVISSIGLIVSDVTAFSHNQVDRAEYNRPQHNQPDAVFLKNEILLQAASRIKLTPAKCEKWLGLTVFDIRTLANHFALLRTLFHRTRRSIGLYLPAARLLNDNPAALTATSLARDRFSPSGKARRFANSRIFLVFRVFGKSRLETALQDELPPK